MYVNRISFNYIMAYLCNFFFPFKFSSIWISILCLENFSVSKSCWGGKGHIVSLVTENEKVTYCTALVCWHHKESQTMGLKQQIYFLTILESGSLRLRPQQGWFHLRLLSTACRWTSSCVFTLSSVCTCLCSYFLFLIRHQSFWSRAHPSSLMLTCLPF